MLKTLDIVKLLGGCLYIAIPRRKSHFNQNMIRASPDNWCSYTGTAEFSEITSQCSHRLSGWLGTIFKGALWGLVPSLKRRNVSPLKLFTRLPPHWNAWLTQCILIWDLVLSLPYISQKECIYLHLFYVFTFAMIQMCGIECKCEVFFCWQIFTSWDCQLQDSIAF